MQQWQSGEKKNCDWFLFNLESFWLTTTTTIYRMHGASFKAILFLSSSRVTSAGAFEIPLQSMHELIWLFLPFFPMDYLLYKMERERETAGSATHAGVYLVYRYSFHILSSKCGVRNVFFYMMLVSGNHPAIFYLPSLQFWRPTSLYSIVRFSSSASCAVMMNDLSRVSLRVWSNTWDSITSSYD